MSKDSQNNISWSTLSTTTERIIDDNPKTWIEAGIRDYFAHSYYDAIEKFNTAFYYVNDSTYIDSSFVKATVYLIDSLYKINKPFELETIINRVGEEKLEDYLRAYFECVLNFREHEYNYWDAMAKRIILYKINHRKKSFIENFYNKIDILWILMNVDEYGKEFLIKETSLNVFKYLVDNGLEIDSYFSRDMLSDCKRKVNFNVAETLAYCGEAEKLEYVFSKWKIDPNRVLIAAVSGQYLDTAIIALENGANPNHRFSELYNQTVLMRIACRRHWDSSFTKIYNYLLKNYNIDVDLQDDNGNTAAMLSIGAHTWFFSVEVDMANALIGYGMNPYIRNKEGKNFMDVCKDKGIDYNP